jgi:hypothetical protein
LVLLASSVLVTALAGGVAISACGGDDSASPGTPNTTEDASSDSGNPGPGNSGPDTGTTGADAPSDTGMGAVSDGAPDAPAMLPLCGTPTFAPSGGTITSGTTVAILPAAGFPAPPQGLIFYTTNGTMPTNASNMYSGPIQVSSSETISAIAYAPGVCADSLVATATFTLAPADAGSTATVTFTPPAAIETNDFTVSLSAGAGATICYSVDGTTVPSCTAAGGCAAGSAYVPTTPVAITGAVTNAMTGLVTLQAIACSASGASSVASQTYGLKAAAPVFQSPAPATIPYPGATPTVSTATTATGTSSVPSLFYTTDGTTPTCGAAMEVNGTAGGASGMVAVAQNVTIKVVACKTGYAPSEVTTGAYTVQLNPPTFTEGSGTYYDDVAPALGLGAAGQNPLGAWVCYSTAGAASCAAATKSCGTGSVVEAVTPSSITVTGTVLNAVTCTPDASKFQQSVPMPAQTYTLQLGPIKFTPNGGSVGPSGMLGSIVIGNSKGDDATTTPAKDYAFICWSNDGTSTPDCKCAGATAVTNHTGVHKSTPTMRSEFDGAVVFAPGNLTLRAVGCDGANPPNSRYLPSDAPAASAVFNSAAQLQAPGIAPAQGTFDNDHDAVLSNPNSVGVVLCYSIDAMDPTTAAAACSPGGANKAGTTCVGSIGAAGSGSASTSVGGLLNQTGIEVRAIACDPSRVLANSPVATSQYTLQVGRPTVSPNTGTVSIGQTLTFTSTTTSSTPATQVTFFYTTNGNAPTCGNGPGIPGITTPPSTESVGTYSISGLETKAIRVVACRAHYTPSDVSVPTSFSGFTVEKPVFAYTPGTYDDYLNPAIQATTSSSDPSYWICYSNDGTTPQCGGGTSTCAAGKGTPIAHGSLSSQACTASPNATATLSGQCGRPATTAVTRSGQTLRAVSCSRPGGAGPVLSSDVTAATYTLDVSDLAFSPADGTQAGPLASVSVDLIPTMTPPAGGSGTNGVTSGSTVCIASGSTPPATMPTVSPTACALSGNGWNCGAPPCVLGASGWACGSPLPAPAILSTNSTYYAFACKLGLVPTATTPGATKTANYTFGRYVHDNFPFSGQATDFNAGTEQIATSNGDTAAYVTWDDSSLYVGFDVANHLSGGSTLAWIHYYIAGTSNGDTTGVPDTTMGGVVDGGNMPDNAAPPLHAQFHVWVELEGNSPTIMATGIDSFDATAKVWSAQTGIPVTAKTVGTFYEIKVPLVSPPLSLSALSASGGFRLAGEGYDTGATQKAFGAWPSTNAAGNLSTGYQAENLTAPNAPNDPTNKH